MNCDDGVTGARLVRDGVRVGRCDEDEGPVTDRGRRNTHCDEEVAGDGWIIGTSDTGGKVVHFLAVLVNHQMARSRDQAPCGTTLPRGSHRLVAPHRRTLGR